MQFSSHNATMTRNGSTTRFLFLGTSTSVGVPVIGCSCEVCRSDHPHDSRSRSSVFFEGPWGRLLIDSGPDLRQQALREKLTVVDAVLYTHEHLDHVAGFDELRAFCWRRDSPLPLYGSPETLTGLARMYPWAFSVADHQPGYVRPEPREVEAAFDFNGLTITPIEVQHGSVRTHGFRFDHPAIGALAYLPDVKVIPQRSLELLHDLDILVIDALRHEEHHTHMTVAEALATINRLTPSQSYLTHLSHELAWEETNRSLPPQVSLAYDGLSLTF
ncbi:MAG: MBL fold metallo-hydrolase [Akkermansiaceae bacterium]